MFNSLIYSASVNNIPLGDNIKGWNASCNSPPEYKIPHGEPYNKYYSQYLKYKKKYLQLKDKMER
jgi:hypothetical protein